MYVVKYRKVFYFIAAILVSFSIFSISFWGLNFGIDFTGGSILEIQFAEKTDINAILANEGHNQAVVREIANNGYIVRTHALSEAEQLSLGQVITSAGGQIASQSTVGPVLGQELQKKAILSIILVILAIVSFITYAFRRVSEPVSSWKYGMVAIIALAHDVLIPTGIFAFLGRNGGFEIDTLFVTGLLVILGFSVHDTIVVFDRTRENLKNGELKKHTFAEVVGMSVTQTFSRSINTSLTTAMSLIVLWVLGPATTRNFALVLILGVFVGTYSSIFVGSPLLVTLQKMKEAKSGVKK